MKIVLTGSSGSVAAGIIDYVLKRTEHSLVLVDLKHPSQLQDPRVQYITADLLDFSKFIEVLQGKEAKADALIHLAGFPMPTLATSAITYNTNTSLSFNALEAAAEVGLRHVVLASSVNALGGIYNSVSRPPKYDYLPLDETHPSRCEDSYSLSKYVMEIQADSFARRFPNMTIASLRFSHVVPERKRGPELETEDSLRNGGQDLWGYVLAAPAARACLLALEAEWRGHEVFYITSNEHCLLNHRAEELAAKFYPGVPLKPGFGGASSFYDCSKAEKILGWKHYGGKDPSSH
jgi:UDP-glucose 4-epimerase